MSDFLSSLRGAATRVFETSAEADARVRTSPEYGEAARQYVGRPDRGFSLSTGTMNDDARQARANMVFNSDVAPTGKDILNQGRDFALDVTSGFTGGVLNLAALAGSGVANYQRATGQASYDVGVPIAGFAQRTAEFLSRQKTEEAQNAATAYGVTSDIITGDNQAQADAEIAAGGNSFLAGANRVFSDVVDTGGNVFGQSEALGSGISQGVGSLLLGGPVAKGATTVVTAGARALAARGLMSPRLATAVAEGVEKYAMTATIGAMEGGGAYSQASQEVMSMSHTDLMEGSEQYARLINSGMSQDQAKNQIASRAGSIAAAIQGPLAAASGSLVAKFEGAPLAATTIRSALSNIGKEAIEEGAQSFSGGLAANVGVRAAADRDGDLLDGLGSGLAEGAIFGAGTAGVFAGPAAAAGVVQRLPGAVRGAVDAVQERGRQINTANVVRPEQAAQAVREAAAPVQTSGDPEIDANIDVLTNLGNQFKFDMSTYEPTSSAEAALLSRLDPAQDPDVWDVMTLGSEMISGNDITPQEKTDLALMIFGMYGNITDDAISQVSELQAKATLGGALAGELNRIIGGQEAIANNPLILKALQDGLDATPEVTLEAVEDISTPEGQQAARKAAAQAVLTPENVSPEVVERLLRHSATAQGLFTPRQVTTLRTASALNQTFTKALADAERMGLPAPEAVRVSGNIQVDNYDAKGAPGKSVAKHSQDINNALAQGNVESAREYLEDFKNFAQHMSNKLQAVNASFLGREEGMVNGRKVMDANPQVQFESYSPKTREWTAGGGSIGTVRFNNGSIALGQQVGVDAEYAIASFNAVAQQNPELGVAPITMTTLDKGLQQKPADVMRAAKAEQRGQQPAKTPDTKTAEAQSQPEQKVAKEPATTETVTPTEQPLTTERVQKAGNEGINRQIALIEDRRDFGVPEVNDVANLAVLRAERDIREAALLSEPSILVEDTQQSPEVVAEVVEPEAKPEVQTTEATTEEVKKNTPLIEEVFPNVVRDTNGDQLMLSGFSVDTENTTRLLGEEAITVEQVSGALQSPEAFQALTGMSKHKIIPEVSVAYNETFQAVLTKVFPIMDKHMRESKHFQKLMNGVDPTNSIRSVNLRLANLMERTEDGGLDFTANVRSAAILGLTDWLAQNTTGGPQRSADDVARKLGMDINDVTEQLIRAYNSSINSQQAHDTLAQTLTQFMGLRAKNDVKNGLTDGLILSLAAELLDSAEEAGLISTESVKIGEKYMVFMKTKKDYLGEAGFNGQTTLISQIVLQDESIAGYTLGTPSGNALKKLQGGGAPTTDAQNTAARNENAIPQTVNRPMLDLVRHLGAEGMIALLANGALDETLNKNDREAREGQNLAVASAYETIMGLAQEMEAAARDGNVELEEVQLFREYAFSSVNRMQQQGQYGDQASKLTRELITPYATTLDMTNPADVSMWRRGIAQALGVKIEKLREGNWNKALDKVLADPAIQSALTMMSDPTATPSDQLIDGLRDALDPTGKKGISMVQIHALRSVAEFQGNSDPKAFFTHVYVEADGVTDGPTNSLIYMRTGGFDAEMVRGLARGGLMFSEAPVALHQIFDPETGGGIQDTYEVSGERLAKALPGHLNDVVQQARDSQQAVALRAQSDALVSAMNILLGNDGFAYGPNKNGQMEFTIGRKQLKNPLTVTVYGSSPAGIAAKIAKEMTRLVYQEVSLANAKAKDAGTKDWQQFMFNGNADVQTFFSALGQLGRNETRNFRRDGVDVYEVHSVNTAVVTDFSNAVELTITPAAVQNLSKAIQAFYVKPMISAINQGMGSSVDGSGIIQRATNFLSIMAKNAFTAAVEAELASQKAKGGTLSEGLSPVELKKVLSRVAFLFPYMEDGSVTVNVKGLSKGLLTGAKGSEVRSAATFKNQSPTQLTIPMPAVAGVAGAAYVNISYGDGRMIIEASPALTGGRLMVFDGINLALKDAAKNGKAINTTVLNALQSGTPFADLTKTFQNMVETIGVEQFSAAEQANIVDELTPPTFNEKVNAKSFIEGMMADLQSELNEAVLDEKARQAVLKRVHISSDHMAALAAPASTAGEDRVDLSGLSPKEQADALDGMFREERVKLVERAALPAPKDGLGELLTAIPVDETSGARVTDTNRLRSMVEALNIPGFQKTLMRRALAALDGTNWKVALGSKDQSNAYAKANGVPFTFDDGDFGVTDVARKTMIIANQSAETLAHELIHAATIDRVTAYFADPMSVDTVSRDAILRLQRLMTEWLGNAPLVAGLRNESTRQAVSRAFSTVDTLLQAGKDAEALNEFMAWNLANQDLMKLNSDIKVESKLALVAKGVLNALKKLFGLPGNDLGSNILFNSQVLMRDGMPSLVAQAGDAILRQSSRTRPDLRELDAKFVQMLKTADGNLSQAQGRKPSELALKSGYQLAQLVSANGFPLTAEERPVFARIVAAYRANAVRDPKLNTQMDVLMGEVLDQLNQSVMMDDPQSQDPGELNAAVERINLLNGTLNVGDDVAGRSLLVPMFVALGATSSVAQRLFNRVEVRNRKAAAPGTTVDSFLKNTLGSAIDNLMASAYGLKPGTPVGNAIGDIMASVVAEKSALHGKVVEGLELPTNLIVELNEKSTKVIGKAIDLTNEGLDLLTAQAKGTPVEPYAKTANKIVQTTLNLFNAGKADDAMSNIFSKINESEIPQELRALFSELLGVTTDNVDVLQLVKIARSTIHRVRQTYRKLLPQRIAEQFSGTVTQDEWTDMHRGLGQADPSVLLDAGLSAGAIIDLFANPKEAKRLLDQKEADIKRLFSNSADILTDSADLAALMLSGAPAHGFVRRNALAIANRAGSSAVGSLAQSSAEVKAVDAYVSLLAMSQLGDKTLNSLSALAAKDREAMAYTLSQIAQARRAESERVPARLRFNVPKGYMPTERQGNMVAVTQKQLNDYTVKGYEIVGSRERGAAESLYDARAGERIYVATNVATPSFKQGILQTVRSTVFGLDAATGLSHDTPTAGMISDPTTVKRLSSALQRGRQKENLAPMFNEQGQVYAFERLVSRADVEASVETQSNAAVAAGQWMGRQFEEAQSAALNDVLIKRLTDRWEAAGTRATEGEFVDLFELAKTDPVIEDAVNLINLRDRNNIINKMGGKFMVERSLYEQVIGYRSMSIGDLWTGNTRLGQEHREGLSNFLTGLLGAEAYKRLTVTEQGWSNLMGDARVAIVVKSMLVPAINGIANFYQLLANGIGPIEIAKKASEKLRETHLYAQNYLKYQGLEADLSAAKGAKRPDRVRQIETEMRKIEDLNKRLSIYPLIQAGEFTQVTEGLTQDDMEMTRGRIWDSVSKWADKLPPAVKTAGRYAIVAKDTALFEGLARTVSYTDFVAKAVLYDNLINKRKVTEKEAMLRVTNEFVNYDLLGGRARSKAEEVGLVWFWSFKLRAIKVAVSMVRNNPLHALLTGFVPGVDAVGTPLDDNMLALFSDGRWDNSLGPENALRALSLNPISQIM